MIEELTTYFLRRDPWVDWTPTITQSGGVAVTVNNARYQILGDTVTVVMTVTCTAAGTGNNPIVIGGIPSAIAPAFTGNAAAIGIGSVRDVGTGIYVGVVWAIGDADWRIIANGNLQVIGQAPNFALASGDQIGIQVTYERA
jgi:hypothetical protein